MEEAPEPLGHPTENTPLIPGDIPRPIEDENDNIQVVLWEELVYLTKSSIPVLMFVHR
jgi:hypothetical protein